MTERELVAAVREKLATYAADVAPGGEDEAACLDVIKACNTRYWVQAWLHHVTGFDAGQCADLFTWVTQRLTLPEDVFARRFNWLCHTCRENPMEAHRYVAKVVARAAQAAKRNTPQPLDFHDYLAATEACPGCGCMPGDGVTDGCTDPDGCGFEA